MKKERFRQQVSLLMLLLVLVLGFSSCAALPASNQQPIKIGLIAPLSGGSAPSGEAIRRGMLIAVEEINQKGGVLGRPLEVIARDVANDKEAGIQALNDLIDNDKIVAVFGGIYSPVMLAQLDTIHERHIPLINPWGSVSAITDNGRSPNYAFRVSVSDKYADEFLVRYALNIIGSQKPAILADTSAWGDSNVSGLSEWLQKFNLTPASVQRFDQGDIDMSQQVAALQSAGADSVLLVANAPEGAAIVRAMAAQQWKVPVVSHWGISGGNFVEIAGVDNAEGIFTLQTYSFSGPASAKNDAVIKAYEALFKTTRVDEISAPVGVAHGYDGVHLLALAIQQAQSTEGAAVRDALEALKQPYDGLIKRFAPPFTVERHDALVAEDYRMAVWTGGKLVLAPQSRMEK